MSARGFAAGIAAAIAELAVLLAVIASPPATQPAHHVRMICEGSICEPAWRYWDGPRNWNTPYGDIGARGF